MKDKAPLAFADTGIPFSVELSLLNFRVYLCNDAAEQIWKELYRVGLQQVEPCWGELA